MERASEHEVIRRWVEERSGKPAALFDADVLRIDFGEADESLRPLTWEQFFKIFDERALEFLYEAEGSDGEQSLTYRFVPRGADENDDSANEPSELGAAADLLGDGEGDGDTRADPEEPLEDDEDADDTVEDE